MDLEKMINTLTKNFNKLDKKDIQRMIDYYENQYDENNIYEIVYDDTTKSRLSSEKYDMKYNNTSYRYLYNQDKEGYECKLMMAS